MIKNKISVVIVDDSAFMRKSLSIMLQSDDEIEVVGTARDGMEGYDLVKLKRPDIVTLDIEMPRMDGLEALQKIMKDCPTPVLMVSSLTTEGADATIKALEYGAIDFIPKELSFVNVNIIHIKEDLIHKVKTIARQNSLLDRLKRIGKLEREKKIIPAAEKHLLKELPKNHYLAIALGISTGGPFSLQKILPMFSKTINCPVFIVQHMPPKFTKSLADRLNTVSEIEIKEAEDGETVRSGVVYIAPGGLHMKLKRNASNLISIFITNEPADVLHRPSVDIMMHSVLEFYGKNTLGVIMTGMGKDGLEGIKELKEMGGHCISQDEESCVVYGMPRAIAEANLADVIAPLERIPAIINKAFEK